MTTPSLLIPEIKVGDWNSVRVAFQKLKSLRLGINASPTFAGITLTNPLTVPSGGTSLATLTDHGILLGSGTGAITPLAAAANGEIPIGSTGADPVLATITGTANRVTVSNAAGSITLTGPQDIHTGAVPTFAGAAIGTLTLADGSITDSGGDISFGNERLTVSNWIKCSYLKTGGTGVKILDDGGETYYLNIMAGPTALTAERILKFDVGNAARTITLSGNPALGDWFDHNVKSDATVTHANLIIEGYITNTVLQIGANYIGTVDDLDLLYLVNNVLTVNGDIVISGANPGLWIQHDILNEAASGHLDFTEAGIPFGASGDAYGFRIKLDGAANKLIIQSGNSTTVTDRWSLARDTGNVDVVTNFTAGTIQADDGFTGSWVNNEGDTVTVVGGIITGVAA